MEPPSNTEEMEYRMSINLLHSVVRCSQHFWWNKFQMIETIFSLFFNIFWVSSEHFTRSWFLEDKCGKKRSWVERVIRVISWCFWTVGNLSNIYFLNVLCCGWAHNSTWAPRYMIFGQKVSGNHANISQIRLWAGLSASRIPHFFKNQYLIFKSYKSSRKHKFILVSASCPKGSS